MSRLALNFALCLHLSLKCRLADALQLAEKRSSSERAMQDPTDQVDMNPTQFLVISSPSQGKVVYTKLNNFETTEGRAYPLVTFGLLYPRGLAFDKKTGFLYIADEGVPAIYRFKLYVNNAGDVPSIATSGDRQTIMKGHPVQWLTIDDDGNLFYTAPDNGNINRIDADILEKVGEGELSYTAEKLVDQKKLQALEKTLASGNSSASNATNLTWALGNETDAGSVPKILELYESAVNPLVSSPSGLWADGQDLYWANTQNGNTAGFIVRGQTSPTLANGTDYFNATAISKASSGAYGLAKDGDGYFFFTQNGTLPGSGLVSCLLPNGEVLDMVETMQRPRGIVWDGDQTIYVADEEAGNVMSFPSGTLASGPTLELAVALSGAYGLVLLSEADEWYGEGSTVDVSDDVSIDANANVGPIAS